MATESIKYVAPDTENKVKTQVFPRPSQHTTGLVDWLTTIDQSTNPVVCWPGLGKTWVFTLFSVSGARYLIDSVAMARCG